METNTVKIIFMPSGRRGEVPKGTSLLDAARQMGVEIESICSGRLTCGKCRVQIESGTFQKHGIVSAEDHVSPPAAAERRLLEEIGARDARLSCSAYACGDVLAFIPEEARGQKQIIRKSASERAIDIVPTVRQFYLEVAEGQLGEHRGDWGRLQDALAAEWDLQGLRIDLPALQKLQPALKKGKRAVTVTLRENEVIDVRPGYQEGVFGLAVDIGSTTIAAHLCDLRTGAVLATAAEMNPQVRFGEDLMSRVSYAMTHSDGLSKMHSAVIETLNLLAVTAAREAGIRAREIHEAVFVGNTTMVHILLNLDPSELGGAPFALANRDAMDFKARDLGLRLHPSANIHVLPAEAGHVGADNVAGLIAEEPYNLDGITLMIDIGTNAEIVLTVPGKMYSASSPTGPAFEGAQIAFGMRAAPGAIERVRIDPDTLEPRFRVIGEARWSDEWGYEPAQRAAGICGSGIVEAVAELFLAGVLRPDGRFNPDLDHPRLRRDGRDVAYILADGSQTTTREPVFVTQNDIRAIQLAKGALYAGAKLLMNRAGVASVDRILLAGAFGSYIDTKYAMILGLIPDCDLEQVYAVGNAAGDGARIALLNREKRREAQRIARDVRYIETAVDPLFQAEFVAALHIPHAEDPFPHLEGLLPETSSHRSSGRRRKTSLKK
ncbi:MAG TPA: ASKHA domain-containing protein [Anaerolineales bacterium]|nr:ASKHA domain-containing protein [Anaerolineales bacterium]